MYKKKCSAQFIHEEGKTLWACPNIIGSRRLRDYSVTQKCWKVDCPGILPPTPNKPKIKVCANEPCNNLSSETSAYCSISCRKRKNSRDYRLRKKNKNASL